MSYGCQCKTSARSEFSTPRVPGAAESKVAVGTVQTLGTLEDQEEITDGSPELNKLKLGTTCYGQG